MSSKRSGSWYLLATFGQTWQSLSTTKSYPGRIILTRLRLDDLDLGAASYKGKSATLALCALCGEEAQTREHFVLRCRALAGNSLAIDLTLGVPGRLLARAFDLLTLATP